MVTMDKLQAFFIEHPKVALAFSGGADSAYLLWAAKHFGADVRAYCVVSQFQPAFELEHARRLAGELGAEMRLLQVDALADEDVVKNPPNRCYYCKRHVFGAIRAAAEADGYPLLIDGTNASDDLAERPGARAMAELGVVSPLRLCGITKPELRARSREAGLFTWNKPAYACLCTRIYTGERVTAEKLHAVEASETYMMSLGFSDFRVRTAGGAAKLQLKPEQFALALAHREEILRELKKYFSAVTLDLEAR